MKTYQPDSETVEQLHGLGYVGAIDEDAAHSHDKPLLSCDVDEVVLHLVDPFVQVLEERGYVLKDHSFRLTGNVFDARSGREATQEEVWAGLTQLFEEQAKRQAIVDGVVDNLPDQVMEPILVDTADVHRRPHAYRLEPLEYADVLGIVATLLPSPGGGLFLLHRPLLRGLLHGLLSRL